MDSQGFLCTIISFSYFLQRVAEQRRGNLDVDQSYSQDKALQEALSFFIPKKKSVMRFIYYPNTFKRRRLAIQAWVHKMSKSWSSYRFLSSLISIFLNLISLAAKSRKERRKEIDISLIIFPLLIFQSEKEATTKTVISFSTKHKMFSKFLFSANMFFALLSKPPIY